MSEGAQRILSFLPSARFDETPASYWAEGRFNKNGAMHYVYHTGKKEGTDWAVQTP